MRKPRLTKSFWRNQIKKLEKYCEKKGWTVEYKKKPHSDFAEWEAKKITLQITRRPDTLFYVFLHEIGHMLLIKNKQIYNAKYGAIFNEFSRTSQTHKIAIVEEELEAWREGFNLAKKLELTVEQRKFERLRAKYVMTYMAWAAKKKPEKNQTLPLSNCQQTENDNSQGITNDKLTNNSK